jgi:hypothetical protein
MIVPPSRLACPTRMKVPVAPLEVQTEYERAQDLDQVLVAVPKLVLLRGVNNISVLQLLAEGALSVFDKVFPDPTAVRFS